MTYGSLKMRLVKAFPGVDLELIEGWVSDVLAEILHELPWSRQNVIGIIQTAAPYSTGTVTLTNGSTAVTGSGTTFTSLMTGRALRIDGQEEIYEFTQTAAGTGTLDRAYQGTTASGLAYKIFQHVYLLPADCRLLEDNALQGFSAGMSRLSHNQMGQPTCYGVPKVWASYMDDSSSPPRMQVQLDPIPDAAYGLPLTYQAETPDPSGTSVSLLPWVQPSALIEGVTAKIQRHLKDYAAAAVHKAEFDEALKKMRKTEAHGSPNTNMQLPSFFTDHRRRRY